MVSYNKKFSYNKNQAGGGARYNSAPFVLQLFLHDNFILKDAAKFNVATYGLTDKPFLLSDAVALEGDYVLAGTISIKESDLRYQGIFEVFDNFHMVESLIEVFADVYGTDKFALFEQNIQMLNDIIAEDKISFDEIPTVEALIEALDRYGYVDIASFLGNYFINDTMNVIDREPKNALSDFYVTKSPDGVYDIIMPFGLILDYSRTEIDFMPEAVDTSVTLEGVDGEIVQDTVYKSRLFDLFAVSMDGLSLAEKESVKEDIAQILHSIKKETKTITFAERETSFDVKYTGAATAKNKMSWVDFELPLKSQSAYGHKQFTRTLSGGGLIENTGDVPVGVVITIKGQCTNPSFVLGDRSFRYNGTIKQYERLVVDTDKLSCYLIDVSGNKINVMNKLDGDVDKKVPVGSLVLTVPEAINNLFTTEWLELVLY